MVEFVEQLEFDDLSKLDRHRTSLRVLDIGTGNGHLLFALQEKDWQSEMTGIDYSQGSVDLAKQCLKEHGGDNLTFEVWDIIESPVPWQDYTFDLVLDKGTFDAISHAPGDDEARRTSCRTYVDKTHRLVKPGGFFLITSCNWTEAELAKWFQSDTFVFYDRIKYPTFKFGGVTGQSVYSVCFQRRETAAAS